MTRLKEIEDCCICKKSLKDTLQMTIIDNNTQNRTSYCESCFKEKILEQIKEAL